MTFSNHRGFEVVFSRYLQYCDAIHMVSLFSTGHFVGGQNKAMIELFCIMRWLNFTSSQVLSERNDSRSMKLSFDRWVNFDIERSLRWSLRLVNSIQCSIAEILFKPEASRKHLTSTRGKKDANRVCESKQIMTKNICFLSLHEQSLSQRDSPAFILTKNVLGKLPNAINFPLDLYSLAQSHRWERYKLALFWWCCLCFGWRLMFDESN